MAADKPRLFVEYGSMFSLHSVSFYVLFPLSMFQTQIPGTNNDANPTPNSLISPLRDKSLLDSIRCEMRIFFLWNQGMCFRVKVQRIGLQFERDSLCSAIPIPISMYVLVSFQKLKFSFFVCSHLFWIIWDQNDTSFYSMFWIHSSSSLIFKLCGLNPLHFQSEFGRRWWKVNGKTLKFLFLFQSMASNETTSCI